MSNGRYRDPARRDEAMRQDRERAKAIRERNKALKKAREEAEEAARVAAGKADVRQTGQEVLIANMGKIKLATSITSASITRGFGNVSANFYKELLEERNKYIIPAALMPPQGVLQLLQPTSMSAFLHATPAQLSSLMPLLRFFIVSKTKDKKTGRPLQREVYFSDFTSEQKIKNLAQARRSHTIYDPDDKKTTKLFSKGSEVGIKSFTWDYHNKHEGDKIIKAKLELYFGTLTELINKEYLNFIFTNGKKNSTDPEVSGKTRGQMKDRLTQLEKEIKTIEDSEVLHPGKSPQKAKNDKVTEDFKQLKVAVGWSMPKGNPADLERLFSSPKKFKSFKAGVRATQKVILLNLTNYDVNFSQEGPVTLTLDYVGSSDNYISSVESDILGQNNFSQGNLNTRQVMIFADDLIKDLKENRIDPNGYLYYQMTNDKYGGKTLVEETGRIPVRLDRLKRESDYIAKKRELAVLQESYASNRSPKVQKKALALLDGYAESVEKAYRKAKKEMRVERYASLVNNLIGGTGRGSRVYVAHATKGANDDVTVKIGGSGAKARQDARDRLKKLAEMTPEDRAKFVKSEQGSPIGRTFTRGAKTKEEMAQTKPEYMAIPFVLFGDIIAAAMQNAEIREDIKLIFGTFTPTLVGITEGLADPLNPHHEPIYDIPIALDYLVQFLFDNMVDKDRDEYPFRLFFDQFLRAITMLLNNQSEYKMRISFDYTLYQTQKEITLKDPDLLLLTKNALPENRKNLFNQIITSSTPIISYYVLFARQIETDFTGNRIKDEKAGIFHYTLGADRGIAKNFNFSKQDVPQFQALQIEEISRPNRYPNALILPQNVSLDMVGNTLHKNGDLICIDSRAALGAMANEVLALGGYYRVVRSSNKISSQGYSTTVDAVFQHRMKNKKSGK